jgi:hypothetical protein
MRKICFVAVKHTSIAMLAGNTRTPANCRELCDRRKIESFRLGSTNGRD